MAEIKEENSYTNILKRLSAFGGVQIFNILLSLLRGKFVALFLGPAGMGVASLYTSSLSPLQQFCGLGLNLAVVKEIAANKDKETSLRRVMRVALRLLIFTSLLGTVVTLTTASVWSKFSFGNLNHTSAYLWLSIFVGLSIAGAGLLALLQGLGEVKRLSKATLVGG
ncbi:MAG: oligosaccharide flippase family protein, partial [Muribaculaceae bacterium]|nr:oligosaccharide flippase family protein [Muribaculaceae bacterium]